MHRDPVSLGHQKVDGLPRIGEGLKLGNEIITECVASVDVRLTKSAALAHKVGRNQLVEPLPILAIDNINKLSDQLFVRFYCHGHELFEPPNGLGLRLDTGMACGREPVEARTPRWSDYLAAFFSHVSLTRNSTIFLIKSNGTRSFSGNWTEPFALL